MSYAVILFFSKDITKLGGAALLKRSEKIKQEIKKLEQELPRLHGQATTLEKWKKIEPKFKRLEQKIYKLYGLLKPSEEFDIDWLPAERLKGKYPDRLKNSGKWLVFVPLANLDDLWAKIKTATEKGLLGNHAKTATTKPNPNASDPNTKVICVYTYDWQDEADVMRIRDELRRLGVTWKIPYKSNKDTLAGKYQVTGHTRISKYYC